MDEASKTERIRGPEFSDQYFSGKVLDIGCGDNLSFQTRFHLIRSRAMPKIFWIISSQVILIAFIAVILWSICEMFQKHWNNGGNW